MATELFVVRHASVKGEAERIFRDNSNFVDDGISSEGLIATKNLAVSGLLSSAREVYTSDLKRASDTAEVLAKELCIPKTITPQLREVYFGAWSGCLASSLDPVELSRFDRNPDQNMPYGAESPEAVLARVRNLITQVENSSGPVVIVSHARFLHAFITEILFGAGTLARIIELGECSVTRLIRHGETWRLGYSNYILREKK